MSQKQPFKSIQGDATLAEECVKYVGEYFHTYNGFTATGLANSVLLWSDVTRTLTLAPVSGTTNIYVYGANVTISGVKTIEIPNATGTYYVFIDDVGNLSYNSSKFIAGDYCIIAHVLINTACSPTGIVFDERRLMNMDVDSYNRLYLIDGAQAVQTATSWALSGYTIERNNPTDANNTFAIAGGEVTYQDRLFTINPLADNGPYPVFYIDSNGFVAWDTSPVRPFKHGTTYIQRCAITGNVGTLTELSPGKFVNYYVAATNSINASFRLILFMGQQQNDSVVSSVNELCHTLFLGNLPKQQVAWLYKVTYGSNSAFTSTGKCYLAYVAWHKVCLDREEGYIDIFANIQPRGSGGGWTTYTTNVLGTIGFFVSSGTSNTIVAEGTIHANHGVVVGSDLFLHLHFFPTVAPANGTTCTIDFQYGFAKGHSEGVFSSTTTTVSATYTFGPSDLRRHIILESPAINLGASWMPDAILAFRMTRRADLDTFTGNIAILQADAHVLHFKHFTPRKAPLGGSFE